MLSRTPVAERRRYPRLPLAIPVFVRCQDGKEKELLEFATALNVSAGGMLIAVRRSLPSSKQLSLEIPSAPLVAVASLPAAARTLRAKPMRFEHAEGYSLIGLKFIHPLVGTQRRAKTSGRKLVSPV